MNKEKVLKVLVPVLIIAVVAGMWFMKNKPVEKNEVAKTEKASSGEEKTDNKSDKTEEKTEANSDEKENNKKGDEKNDGSPDFSFEFSEALNFDEMKKHGLPIIADYGSAKCGPCVAMHPDLEAVHKEYEGKAFIKYADVWESQDATSNVPVRVTPTQVLFTAEGKPYVPSEAILQKYGQTSFTMYQDKKTNAHVLTVHEGMLREEELKELLKEMGVKG